MHARWRILLVRLGVGRSPLRRWSDLLESAVLVLVLFGALVVVWAAVQVGQAAFDQGAAVAAHGHHTVAVLQENAQDVSSTVGDSGSQVVSRATATWLAPDGVQRSGVITVDYGELAGQSKALWTNDNGEPVSPPKTTGELRAEAIMVGALFALAWLALLATGYALFLLCLNRIRLSQWGRAWARVSENSR